jgi:hypothetical protein
LWRWRGSLNRNIPVGQSFTKYIFQGGHLDLLPATEIICGGI